jgi:hypothetical protein
MADKWGYREGPQQIETYFMDSAGSASVKVGDHVKFSTAGYVIACGAGDNPIGVAVSVGFDPATDGDETVRVDVSEWSIYEYPIGTGTGTLAMIGTTCDLAGARSIDVTASADDNIYIVNVDVANNTARIRHVYPHSGVV